MSILYWIIEEQIGYINRNIKTNRNIWASGNITADVTDVLMPNITDVFLKKRFIDILIYLLTFWYQGIKSWHININIYIYYILYIYYTYIYILYIYIHVLYVFIRLICIYTSYIYTYREREDVILCHVSVFFWFNAFWCYRTQESI